MPDRVSARIAAAFAIVGIVAVLAVGAGMFVSLRTLHQEATISGLQDLAQPVLARVRNVGAVAELRAAATALKPDLPADVGLYALAGGRVVSAETGAVDADVASIDLTGVALGKSTGGDLRASDGSRVLYSATVVRAAAGVIGKIAIVLTAPDKSGALALRDLLRVLPFVAIVILLVVGPIAWLLARSITRPLRRLAEATATVPVTGVPTPPIEPEGPREVRNLTGRFNAMTAELERIRAEERELLANIRHDLKTPLTVVGGFAEALRDGTASGEGIARAGDAIAQEAARMSGLVEDLRSIDEVGTAGVALRPEQLDAASLVADAVARFEPRAAAAGVDLRSVAEPGLALAADRAADRANPRQPGRQRPQARAPGRARPGRGSRRARRRGHLPGQRRRTGFPHRFARAGLRSVLSGGSVANRAGNRTWSVDRPGSRPCPWRRCRGREPGAERRPRDGHAARGSGALTVARTSADDPRPG